MNDDLVQPDRGFGEHPHRDVEICSYIVEGDLSHKDSMGTQETLNRGAIQFMTAGSGVYHSEHNLNKVNPLRFIQIWITTRKRGLTPNYGSFIGDYNKRHNSWSHLVSDTQNKEDVPIKINQDVNLFVTELDENISLSLEIKENRQAYLLCIEGSVSVSSSLSSEKIELERHDAMEIYGGQSLEFLAKSDSLNKGGHLLVVEMAFVAGSGRKDV